MCTPQVCSYVYHFSLLAVQIISHYQYLGVLLFSGFFYLHFNKNVSRCCYGKIMIIFGAILSTLYLIQGLLIFRQLTKQFLVASSPAWRNMDLNQINSDLARQSWLGLLILLILGCLFTLTLIKGKKRE